MNTAWEIWNDVHDDPDSLKRIKSASLAENTPISVDANHFTCVFQGTHGTYNTSLTKCQCVDFSRRHKPCKHMYRLAYEFGLFSISDVRNDSSKIKTPSATPKQREELLDSVIKKLNSYGDHIEIYIKEILYLHLYRDSLFPCDDTSIFLQPIADALLNVVIDPEKTIQTHSKKDVVTKLTEIGFQFPDGIKSTQKARYDWCVENAETIAPLIYKDFVFLEPAGDLLSVKRKVYSYLLHKFEPTYL